MNKRVWMIAGVVELVCMLAIIGISVLLGGCTGLIETATGGTVPMKCHWTFVATTFIGAIGVVTALLALVSRDKEGRRTAAIASAAVALASILIASPIGIGLCGGNEAMACHQSASVLWVVAGIALVIAVVQAVKADPEAVVVPKKKL